MKIIISLFHHCRFPKQKCIERCIFTTAYCYLINGQMTSGKNILYLHLCILFIYSHIFRHKRCKSRNQCFVSTSFYIKQSEEYSCCSVFCMNSLLFLSPHLTSTHKGNISSAEN